MNQLFDKKESWGKRKRKSQQDKALADMVKLGYEKSGHVKAMLDAHKINPANIKTREDLVCLPVTSREKLVEMEQLDPPYAGLENPDISIDRVFTSPGPV